MIKKILLITMLLILALNGFAVINNIQVVYPNSNEVVTGTIDLNFKYNETQPYASQLQGRLFYSLMPNIEQPPLAQPIALNLDLKNICNDDDSNPSTYQYCEYTWDTTQVEDGLWYFVVSVTDNYGNKKIDSSNNPFRIDNTAPTTSVNVEEGKWYNSMPLNLAFSCDDAITGSGCRYTAMLLDDSTVKVAKTSTSLTDEEKNEIATNLNTTIDSSNWSIVNYPLNTSISIEGMHSVKYYSKDLAENTETVKQTDFGLDSLNPLIEITQPTTDTYSNLIEFNVQKIENSDINADTIKVYFNNNKSSVFNLNDCSESNSNYYCSYNESTLIRGNTYTLRITAEDKAGNQGENSITFTYLDYGSGGNNTNDLTLNVIQPNNATYIKGNYNIQLSLSETESNPLYLTLAYSSTENTFENTIFEDYTLDENSYCNSNDFTQTTTCSINWDTTSIPDGNYYIDALLYDNQGNSISDSSNGSFMIDNTEPVLSVNAPTDWQNTDFNVTANASDNSNCFIVEYSIDSGNWSEGSTAEITTDGNHSVNFKATDCAGNSVEETVNALLDKTKPEFSNEQPQADSYTNDENTLVSIKITDDLSGLNLNSIYLTLTPPVINSSLPVIYTGPQTFTLNDSELSYDDNTSTLTLDLTTPFEEKTYTVFVYAEDNAANDANFEWQFMIEKEKPETIVDLTVNLTQENYVNLDWSNSSDNECLAYYYIYRAEEPITSANKYNYLIGYSNESEAFDSTAELGKTYYYRVTAIDCAGNESSLSNMVKITIPEEPRVINLTPRYDTIYMQNNDSYAVTYDIENITDENQCMTIETTTDSGYIEATPAITDLCLNPKEKTSITVTVQTINAPFTSFEVKTSIKTNRNTEEAYLNVIVTENLPVSVIALTNNICREKQDAISVQLINNSNEPKTVYLRAGNEMFLPYFKTSKIELDAYQEKYVDLIVQTNSFTETGDYSVKIYATIDGQVIIRDAEFTVEDCSQTQEATFKLNVSSSCVNAEKEKTSSLNISIENLLNEKQTINLQAVSDIPTEIQRQITLEPNETTGVSFTVKPRLKDTTGEHTIKVYAWNSNYREEELACVNVQEKGSSKLELLENNLTIEKEKTSVIGFKVTNNGDFSQDYEIELNNPSNFNTQLTESSFNLNKGREKTIYLSITTTKESQPGQYYIDIIVKDNERTLIERLYFKVIEFQNEKEVMIASYPEIVEVKAGSLKVIDLIILNNSNEDKNLRLVIENYNEGISLKELNFTVKAGETIVLKEPIKTDENLEDGNYAFKAKIFKENEKLDEKTITIKVITEKTKEESLMAGLAGLISLASGELALGFLILLLVIIAIMLIFKGRQTMITEKENWLMPKNQWKKQ